MRRALVVVAVLTLASACAWWLARGGARGAGGGASEEPLAAASVERERAPRVVPGAPAPAAASGERAPAVGASEAVSERVLRVRVVDEASGATLRDCSVWLEHPSVENVDLPELPDGTHESREPLVPGTEVVVSGAFGWSVARDRIELDAVPPEPVIFMARAVPTGRVRGIAVDELDGTPRPFLRIDADGEELVSDAGGAFEGTQPHESGVIEFRAGGWSHEVGGFDPASDQPLIVPVRVGPTVFVALDRTPSAAWAAWLEGSLRPDATMIGWDKTRRGGQLELDPVPRVQFQHGLPRPLETGELVVYSIEDFLVGRAALAPGLGSLERPLAIALRPFGVVSVRPEFSREPSESEGDALAFALADADGHDAEATLEFGAAAFLVQRAGELALEARLDGEVLARATVIAELRAHVDVRVRVPLPPEEAGEADAEPPPASEPLHDVAVHVTSARNQHPDARLSLMRRSDGEETQLDVEWTKEDGRWVGRAEDRAPAGAHRVQLEVEPAYEWDGPRWIEVPPEGELRFTIDDRAPLVDVYLVPVAAEDGRALASFDAELVGEGGDPLGGDEFVGPTAPVLRAHPRTVAFDWACTAPGRGYACGTFEPDGGEGDIVIPVVLARGYGALVYVGDAGRHGLGGVRVYADGVLAGVTSRHGILCLGGERPERLTLEYEDGWADDGYGDLYPDGTFDDEERTISVFLAPPPR